MQSRDDLTRSFLEYYACSLPLWIPRGVFGRHRELLAEGPAERFLLASFATGLELMEDVGCDATPPLPLETDCDFSGWSPAGCPTNKQARL
jgi:hypothetical protein